MSLTPEEIVDVDLKSALRGYATDQVDQLLDRIADQVERTDAELADLRARLDDAQTRLAAAIEAEGTVQRTLVTAQATADRTIADAQEFADRTLAEAQAQAGEILDSAERDAAQHLERAQAEAQEAEAAGQRARDEQHQQIEEARERLQSSYDIERDRLQAHLDELRHLVTAHTQLFRDHLEAQQRQLDGLGDAVEQMPTAQVISGPEAAGWFESGDEPSDEPGDQSETVGEDEAVVEDPGGWPGGEYGDPDPLDGGHDDHQPSNEHSDHVQSVDPSVHGGSESAEESPDVQAALAAALASFEVDDRPEHEVDDEAILRIRVHDEDRRPGDDNGERSADAERGDDDQSPEPWSSTS